MDLEVGGKSGVCYHGNQETMMLKEWGTAELCPEVEEDDDSNVAIELGAFVRGLSEVVDKPHRVSLMFLTPSHNKAWLSSRYFADSTEAQVYSFPDSPSNWSGLPSLL